MIQVPFNFTTTAPKTPKLASKTFLWIWFIFEGYCDASVGLFNGRRYSWCPFHKIQGPRKLYIALLFCSPSSPQGARWRSWVKSTVLQGTEGGRYDRDSLWCLHAPCTGAQNNLYSIFMNRKSELKWKGWLIYVFGPSVLGPSACDGLHQWDDSIHPLEEEGNRRGTCKSGIFVKLMWK